jgi:hypothetical protein
MEDLSAMLGWKSSMLAKYGLLSYPLHSMLSIITSIEKAT